MIKNHLTGHMEFLKQNLVLLKGLYCANCIVVQASRPAYLSHAMFIYIDMHISRTIDF